MLGLTFGLAVTIGNTIGAGILRTPGDIAGLLPSAVGFIGIWVVGGLQLLCRNLSIAGLIAVDTIALEELPVPARSLAASLGAMAYGLGAGFVVSTKPLVPAFAVQAGHAIWFIIGAVVTGQYKQVLLDLRRR